MGEIFWRTKVNGRCFLALYRWHIGFHPTRNAPCHHLVWVKMPSLPLEFWTVSALSAIGDNIRKCRFVDTKCMGHYDKRITWILVEVSFFGGHPAEVDLEWEGIVTDRP